MNTPRILGLVAMIGLAVVVWLAVTLPEDLTAAPSRIPNRSAGRVPEKEQLREVNTAPAQGSGDARPVPIGATAKEKAQKKPKPGSLHATGIVLYGLVVDEQQQPLGSENTIVFVIPLNSSTPLRVTPKPAGYAFAGLTPGRHTLICRSAGFAELKKDIDIRPSPQVQRLDLVLVKKTPIRVKILTPDGAPLNKLLMGAKRRRRIDFSVDVSVIATRNKPNRDFPTTDGRMLFAVGLGTWRNSWAEQDLESGIAGTLQVSAQPPFWVSAVLRHALLATERVEPGQDEVVLEVAMQQVQDLLGSVQMRFVDAVSGKPIPKLRVSLDDSQSGSPGKPTDADGVVTLTGLRPGPLMLDVRTSMHEIPDATIDVISGSKLDLLVRLQPHQHIRGRVVDSQGNPAQARLSIRRLDPLIPGQKPGGRRGARAGGSKGSFEFQMLGKSRYLLTATQEPNGVAYQVVDTRGGSLDDVLVTIRKASLVRLTSKVKSDQKPMVTIRNEAGLALWSRRVAAGWEIPIKLIPGRYKITVQHHGETARSRTLVVGSGPLSFVVR